jgi:hypothetical protein
MINPTDFNVDRLIKDLLNFEWQRNCDIVPDYRPPYDKGEGFAKCVVRYRYSTGHEIFLRYSQGPRQGYFWDVYGSDMHRPELALVALSQAPPPPRVGTVIPLLD